VRRSDSIVEQPLGPDGAPSRAGPLRPGSHRGRVLTVLLLATTLLAVYLSADAQAATRGLKLGFYDGIFTTSPTVRAPWLARTVTSGADIVRIQIGWVAPNTRTRPAGFNARDPGDPAYHFSVADSAIVDATSRGLRVLVSFTGAPRWAEGRRRSRTARAGTWKPDPGAIEEYGAALARRYSGSFPDPARPGHMLPRIDAFQFWNEPNLDIYLTPQWSGGRPFAPAHYRRMLNAFYDGVKSVRPEALVVTGGTAPFGDPSEYRARKRIMPARFVRLMLCMTRTKGRLRKLRCPAPARFDVLAHHPYTIGFPRRPARNKEDVSIVDIHKLTRLLRSAERSGRALPRTRHRLWATEVSFDSKPPDRRAVSIARHARYLQETFYLLWRQGVDTITWFQIRDAPLVRTRGTAQSGTYYRNGKPKPAARAFRFPLVAARAGSATLRVWGRAPVAGVVQIERRTRSGWRPIRTVRVLAHGTFLVRIAARGKTRLRARVGNETSLAWSAS